MLTIDKLAKALEIIEEIVRKEFVSAEIFSDGSGQLVDSDAIRVLEWDKLEDLEEMLTDYIYRKGK